MLPRWERYANEHFRQESIRFARFERIPKLEKCQSIPRAADRLFKPKR